VAEAAAVLHEIRRILAEELALKTEVTPRHHLIGDLQLDSLGLTVLAVELENRFRIRLAIEDSAEVGTVEDLVRLVLSKADAPEGARGEGDPC
jgi:acyl carrier protein